MNLRSGLPAAQFDPLGADVLAVMCAPADAKADAQDLEVVAGFGLIERLSASSSTAAFTRDRRTHALGHFLPVAPGTRSLTVDDAASLNALFG
jgi:hypothetical protein